MKQSCPRRLNEIGPWEYKEGLDIWEPNRWEGKRWVWPWIPRTCSFCGCVYPDDALRLISEGWEIDIAKKYKFYLNPPGTQQALEVRLRNLRESREDPVPSVQSPIPPVKGYTMHFSDEQIERLNQYYKEQQK